MACRVGITTDPERRRQEWLADYPHMRNWRIVATYPTRSQAQRAENELSQRQGCMASPGGAGNEYAHWSVYYFEY